MAPAMSMEAADAPKAVILLTTESLGVLPVWGAIGFIIAGAAFGGLLIFLVFKIKNWISPPAKEVPKEESPLLPNSSAECPDGG